MLWVAAPLATSAQQAFLDRRRGRPGPLPPPVDSMDALWTPAEAAGLRHLACSAHTPGVDRWVPWTEGATRSNNASAGSRCTVRSADSIREPKLAQPLAVGDRRPVAAQVELGLEIQRQ